MEIKKTVLYFRNIWIDSGNLERERLYSKTNRPLSFKNFVLQFHKNCECDKEGRVKPAVPQPLNFQF